MCYITNDNNLALIDYMDDIFCIDFEIYLDEDDVKIHASRNADNAELPPQNMAVFSKFTSPINSEKIQLSDDILFDIKELSSIQNKLKS